MQWACVDYVRICGGGGGGVDGRSEDKKILSTTDLYLYAIVTRLQIHKYRFIDAM